ICQELWTKGAVVGFDHAVNQYIRQLRSALGDNREAPLYIETAPRRGYRFIAPVSRIQGPGASTSVPQADGQGAEGPLVPSTDTSAANASARVERAAQAWHRAAWVIVPIVVVTLAIAAAIVFIRDRHVRNDLVGAARVATTSQRELTP